MTGDHRVPFFRRWGVVHKRMLRGAYAECYHFWRFAAERCAERRGGYPLGFEVRTFRSIETGW